MIEEKLLIEYNAQKIKIKKGEYIIKENSSPKNYYQIITGQVKMITFNSEGKEFVQGIFLNGESFGEPPLFIGRKYPANGVAIMNTELFCLSKKQLEKLIEENPSVALYFIQNLSKRLHYKSIMAAEIAFENPEHRIIKLLTYHISYFKNESENDTSNYKINLTRQQIADITGLRVETVIKTVKKLEKENKLKIINRKIYIRL